MQLGEAFIAILPDMAGFTRDLERGTDRATNRVRAKVLVTPDLSNFARTVNRDVQRSVNRAGGARVRVTGDTSQLVSDVERGAQRAAASADTTVHFRGDTSELGSGLKDTGAGAGETAAGGFLGGFAGKLKGGAGIALGLGTLIGGAAAKIGIGAAANNEQLKISFTTLLASSNKAKKELSWLNTFAAKTPFDLTNVSEADRTLLGFGFDTTKVRRSMVKDLGNIAAAVGIPAERFPDLARVIGQVHASGTAQLDDINQLVDAGVPIWKALSTQTGQSVAELRKGISKGQLSAQTFEKALTHLSRSKFGDAMEKQSQTLVGLWSTVQDTISQGLAKAFTPAIPLIKQVLNGLSLLAATVLPGVAKALGFVTESLGKLDFNKLWSGLGGTGKATQVTKTLRDLGGFFVYLWGVVKTNLGKIAASIGPAFEPLKEAVVKDLLPAIRNILPVLKPVVKFILDVLGSSVVGVIKGAFRALTGLVKIISGVFNLISDLVHGRWGKIWGDVKQILSGALQAIVGLVQVWLNWGIIGVFRKGLAKLVLTFTHPWGLMAGVTKRSMGAISAVVKAAWTRSLQPIFRALNTVVRKVVAPTIRFLWNAVVKPTFAAIAAGAKGWWGTVRNVFNAVKGFLAGQLFPAIKALWSSAIKPTFQRAGDTIRSVWNGVIKPVFSTIKDWVGPGGKLQSAFRNGVAGIKSVWNGLKRVAAAPVNFIIDTVYNKGIKRVVNAIPGVPNLDNLPTLKFATGGPVSGGVPGLDSVPALMMPGEHVLTAKEVRNAGGHKAIYRLRELLANGRLDFKQKVGDLGLSTDRYGHHLPRFARGGELNPAAVAKAKAFARAQAGKPYIWGGVGPNGYDCSGFISAITNVLLGRYPYSRLGTSGSFPWAGFKPGYGEFSVGAFTGSPGHVAGTLDGLNVESTNGSVRVGSAARGANWSGFTRVAHLGSSVAPAPGSVAGVPVGYTRAQQRKIDKGESDKKHWYDVIGEIKGAVGAIRHALGAFKGGGWWSMMHDTVKQLGNDVVTWANDKIPNSISIPGPNIPLPHNPIPHFARGGIAPGGWARVGEHGPETAWLPRGTYVEPRMPRRASRDRYEIHITNWDDGKGYIRSLAVDEISNDAIFQTGLDRMRRG